jgi:hypothetical protein
MACSSVTSINCPVFFRHRGGLGSANSSTTTGAREEREGIGEGG